ncbi:hypothetical protein [Chitinivorax sp. B]|uniref:hypothetical protein n=1 Tax=Chitinivorax sp. B TaxID=2502235 RepID=UPI0010F8B39D|nr:hypothetical protein [Chitinivorax sp. B]
MALRRAVMSNILMQNDNGYQMQMRLTANCKVWHDNDHSIHLPAESKAASRSHPVNAICPIL